MSGPVKFKQTNASRVEVARRRQQRFLSLISEGKTIAEALREIGLSKSAYAKWRQKDPNFRATVDLLRSETNTVEGTMDFARDRLLWFGMRTTPFQQLAIEAYENTPPGNILLILWPPEHGKTTLFEDYAAIKLGYHPNWRFTVGSERQDMSRKILARVKARMDPGGPFPGWVAKFGPFRPQLTEGPAQPWGADYFSVFKKGAFDERDYSMVALGIGSAIAGTRTDHLHVDDVQSLKSAELTEKLVEVFRQDWLTRPGERGITTINGTRVRDDDFYERIMEEFPPEILKVIKFPAIVYDAAEKEHRPLWPYDEESGAGYTMKMLDRLRTKVGEDAWARNYMQNPRPRGSVTFDSSVVEHCRNPQRAAGDAAETGYAVLGLDPALGSRNALSVVEFLPSKLRLLDMQERIGLTRNEQIMEMVEDRVLSLRSMGTTVTDLVIESKNFQAGLARDERLLEMRDRYGFQIHEHDTGVNKYDANIGISSMATSFRRCDVELPFAGDDYTRRVVDEFERQLYAWRPLARGNKLRQDQVMAFWFAWILWRNRAMARSAPDTGEFKAAGLPWKPTGTGLLVPNRRAS